MALGLSKIARAAASAGSYSAAAPGLAAWPGSFEQRLGRTAAPSAARRRRRAASPWRRRLGVLARRERENLATAGGALRVLGLLLLGYLALLALLLVAGGLVIF